ncbi:MULTISPECIES: hypothetical protein [Cupriavidus]|uniref:DUF2147 domain-containing protein n=1 Tax=Cupriavidus campinensis TaxID=151783 RepID=A0ABY3EHH9_9BURK|nr:MULTISPECIES: hypothetical protein [Cupriavidus]TSP10393.1 hypothetical protein FGG12_23155 [Cupriavidus campinensis]
MVKTWRSALASLLLVLGSPTVDAREVKAVAIEAVGLSRLEEMAEPCRKFRPSAAQIKRFFSRAYPVDAIYYSKKIWSPCWAEGTVEFSDGNRGKWRLNSGGVAYLQWSHSGDVILYHKTNGWADPFRDGYDGSI